MFVNKSGHEYDESCQEYEIVTIVNVGSSHVKVQWQSGFMQRVRMQDLSEMPSLSTAGGSPDMEDIPDMPTESDRSLQKIPKSRSPRTPSRRRKEIRRMPDMPSLEGGFMDF